MIEAECQECKEIFMPNDEEDIEHVVRLDGKECGGLGIILGRYILSDNTGGISPGDR